MNLSPSTFGDPWAIDLFDGVLDRIVLELSESQIVDDYEELRQHVWDWTSRGARLAIDDTGSGYASLRHVLQLRPDFIKLDRSLINGIEYDRHRRALGVRARGVRAGGPGAAVIAEGVERGEELGRAARRRVGLAQGYLMARPGPAWPAAAGPEGAHRSCEQRARSRAAIDIGHAFGARSAGCEATGRLRPRRSRRAHAQRLPRAGRDRLRCQAQRGIWQVLDGMAPNAGITGDASSTDR